MIESGLCCRLAAFMDKSEISEDIQYLSFLIWWHWMELKAGLKSMNRSQMIAGCFQMLEEGVKEACHSTLSPSLGSIGKLVGVQMWSDNWEYGVANQFFQVFHYY